MDGREIGPAEWNGDKVAAFPVPHVEQKRQERASGIIKKAHKEIDRANAELGNTLDQQIGLGQVVIGGKVMKVADALSPIVVEAEPQQPRTLAADVGETSAPEAEVVQPRRRGDLPPSEVMAEWHGINNRLIAGEEISAAEANWHSVFQRHPIFKSAIKDAPFVVAARPEERRASA
jgi:putative transposase